MHLVSITIPKLLLHSIGSSFSVKRGLKSFFPCALQIYLPFPQIFLNFYKFFNLFPHFTKISSIFRVFSKLHQKYSQICKFPKFEPFSHPTLPFKTEIPFTSQQSYIIFLRIGSNHFAPSPPTKILISPCSTRSGPLIRPIPLSTST